MSRRTATADRAGAATLRRGLGELVTGLQALAARTGDDELVAPLVAECARPPGSPAQVVVAGATKRGKSALVNALLGRPGLVPVDSDVATGVHISVRWGERDRALVRAADADPVEIGLDEVARYASEQHNPGNALDVLAVEIETGAALLEGGLELVDTPGVDSVVARHADVTLAALALADALVLVVDPSRPLVAPELAFLAGATGRVGHVVFVLTKLDLHREWRRVLEDDKALVAAHAPRFAGAPFLPVSSKLKTAADAARDRGRDALADRAEQESGVAPLTEELARVVTGIDVVRLGNVVQLAAVVCGRYTATVRARCPAADDTDGAGLVEADQERLRRLTDGSARWRQDLAHGFRRLQLDVDAHLAAATVRADREMADSLAVWTPERGESLPRELDDTVRVLWLEVLTLVRDRVEELVADLLATLTEHGVELAPPELSAPLLEREATREVRAEDDPTSRGIGGALGSYGAAAGLAFGAERLLMSLGGVVLGIGGFGLGAAIGVAGVALRRRTMARVREQRAAQRLAARTLADARALTQREFTRHLVDVQFGLETTASELLVQRRHELEDAVRQGRAMLARSTGEREKARREAGEVLAALDKLRTDAAALHQIVEAARTAGRPSSAEDAARATDVTR